MSSEKVNAVRDLLKENGVSGRKAPSLAKKVVAMLETETFEDKKEEVKRSPQADYIHKVEGAKNRGHVGVYKLGGSPE